MKPIVAIICVSFLISCANENNNDGPGRDDKPGTEIKEPAGVVQKEESCYAFIAGRDTLAARLVIAGEEVNGKLVYDNYQKDGSSGQFSGELSGNIIHGWYHFEAEGMKSVRELYFKLEGDKLIAGIANEQVKGDTAYVPDAAKVNYQAGMIYNKTGCGNIKQLN